MCGIVAYSGKQPIRISEIASFVKVLEKSRGGHGWGFVWEYHQNLFCIKGIGKLPMSVIRQLRKYKSCSILGHTRLRSKGKISYENTHPFLNESESLALVHNGTIFSIPLQRAHLIYGETDSERLLHYFEELSGSPLERLEKMHRNLKGILNLAILNRFGEIFVLCDGQLEVTKKLGFVLVKSAYEESNSAYYLKEGRIIAKQSWKPRFSWGKLRLWYSDIWRV